MARTPVRVADVGGWTDTWFGSPGQVCSLAMGPAVEVEAAMVARPEDGVVHLRAPAVDLDLVIGPDPLAGWDRPLPGRDPLLEHAVGAILGEVAVPDDVGIDLHVASAVPPGASLGTSASVLVAVLGALDALVAGGHRSPEDLARLAHEVETGQAGREAGVQDQWA
ncbi:MAG: hypothetical protein KDA97_05455, partial [Acidimicrobiales bacterium]|nr:hypothetical protein [Acidimicrobiales bacterium]